jgi:hypothetical protein
MAALWTPLAQATDTISGSAFVTRYDAYAWTGYGGTLGYQHASDMGGVIVALSDTRFPVGTLAVVDIDGYRHEWEHVWLSVGGSLGNAATGNQSSTLYKARIAADAQLDPQWVVHLADQFIDLDTIHGHLMTTGAEYRPTPLWGVNVAGGYGVSGTLADRYGQLVLNWYGKDHLYGGLVLGRTGYDPANLGEIAVVRRLFQAYTGAAIPVGHAVLTLALDTLNLEGASRQTLRVGFIKQIDP